MNHYTAFLRAINVGGRTVKMETLRAIFAAMGFADVSTFIASGNVLFTADSADTARLEREVKSKLKGALGFETAVFVRSMSEVCRIAKYEPFGEGPDPYYVGFLADIPDESARIRLLKLASPTDEINLDGRELYWRNHRSFQDSPLSGAAMEKALGMRTTLRNINTVRRIAAKLSP